MVTMTMMYDEEEEWSGRTIIEKEQVDMICRRFNDDDTEHDVMKILR